MSVTRTFSFWHMNCSINFHGKEDERITDRADGAGRNRSGKAAARAVGRASFDAAPHASRERFPAKTPVANHH